MLKNGLLFKITIVVEAKNGMHKNGSSACVWVACYVFLK